MWFKNVAAILELNCLAVSLRKDTSFYHDLTVWTMYFVDIVVSYDCCAALQRINFFFSLSITLYVYHVGE